MVINWTGNGDEKGAGSGEKGSGSREKGVEERGESSRGTDRKGVGIQYPFPPSVHVSTSLSWDLTLESFLYNCTWNRDGQFGGLRILTSHLYVLIV